jgi:hypothetical protein
MIERTASSFVFDEYTKQKFGLIIPNARSDVVNDS